MEHLTPGFRQGELLLERLCRERQVIPGVSERIRFYPGHSLLTNPDSRQILINGRFGLVLTLSQDPKVVVAQCGFDFCGGELVVTNTPQGLTRSILSCHPEQVIKAALAELKKGNFRSELLGAVIRIAQAFKMVGIKRIKGIAAENHDKVDVNGGPLSLYVALRSMNALYEKHGFTKDETGDYYLDL